MSVESADENFERKRNEMKTMVGLEIAKTQKPWVFLGAQSATTKTQFYHRNNTVPPQRHHIQNGKTEKDPRSAQENPGISGFRVNHRLRFVAFSFEIFIGGFNGHPVTKIRKMRNRQYFFEQKREETKSVVCSKTPKPRVFLGTGRAAETAVASLRPSAPRSKRPPSSASVAEGRLCP